MQASQVLIYLALFGAIARVGGRDGAHANLTDIKTESHEKGPDSDYNVSECSACRWRKENKALRLESIKSQILSKLRLKEAPNISRDTVNQLLPKAPPLQRLLDQYDIQGDDNNDALLEEDDYHATTETLITMATERK